MSLSKLTAKLTVRFGCALHCFCHYIALLSMALVHMQEILDQQEWYIGGSRHEPPGAHLVPELVEDMCDYVNANLDKPAVHLSAFALWRLNWIHPFVDGNGRTARALSYFILCARLGYRLPGVKTIPELIAAHKKPYYAALEAADEAARKGKIDVSEMEQLIAGHLATQLYGVHQQATGGGEPPSGAPNR
jgi:Fic family protein